VLAVSFDVVIDRAISAPGHGKDVVDGLNAMDKIYLRQKMCMIGTPEANDGEKRMAAHAMVEDAKASLAAEAKRLLSDPARKHGVQGGADRKKLAAGKMSERRYFVQDPKKVQFTSVKKVVKGLPTGEHNGLLGHYNVRADKDLGVGRVALRRVPHACAACLKQLDKPWCPGVPPEEQPRYASSTECELWPIFEQEDGEPGLNDWKIVQLVSTKDSSAEEEEEVQRVVLASLGEMMAERIHDGGVGAFPTEDDDADGYYIVDWKSEPYTLQEDVELKEYTPDAIADQRAEQAAKHVRQEGRHQEKGREVEQRGP